MCRSNAPVVRANEEESPGATILPFVISTVVVIHPWIQQHNNNNATTTTDVIMIGNNNMDSYWDSEEDTVNMMMMMHEINTSYDDEFLLLPLHDDNNNNNDDQEEEQEQERQLNVYRGLERPRDDEDWRMIFDHYTTDGLALVTGMEYQFREWEDAWMMVMDHDDDNDNIVEYSIYYY